MKRWRIGLTILSLLCLLTGCREQATVATFAPTTTTAVTVATVTAEATTAETVLTTDGSTTAATITTTKAPAKGTQTTVVTTALTTVKATTSTATTTTAAITKPEPAKELRGAWVSYFELAELLQPCKTPTQAKTALDGLMATLKANKMNTVFFHVRANGDAYYKSTVFKTAAAAEKLVAAGFDPLAYAVQAAHREGLALHAWVNPYRVGKDAAYLIKDVPTMQDAAGRYYYVPTSPKAQKLILDGVREILSNYAVDGIQYDDYFYPEDLLEDGTVYGFESNDYEAYCEAGGALTVGDWRRAGVDALIAATHTLTAAKDVPFGVSPAADEQKTYDSLYADCRKWLAEDGYVDYLCPQIYTGFENGTMPFDGTLDTWLNYPRHRTVQLYVGVALYKIGLKSDTYAGVGKSEWVTHDDVMRRSVEYARKRGITGIGFYSYSYFSPAEKAGLSQTADVKTAENEIKNLLDVL